MKDIFVNGVFDIILIADFVKIVQINYCSRKSNYTNTNIPILINIIRGWYDLVIFLSVGISPNIIYRDTLI